MSNINLIFASIVIFFSIYIKRDLIAEKTNLIDTPNNKLKNHKKKTPIIGGIILNAITILILLNLTLDKYVNNFLFIKILIFSVTVSIIGIIDDKYDIKAVSKFFYTTFILVFFLTFIPELRIKYIVFSDNFLIKNLDLENKFILQIFITTLCYQLLIHAFNMADGHDGIASLMAITWLAYIYFAKINFQFLLPIMVTLLLFLYFNLSSKIFLGDSGNYFLSTLLSSLIILNNNNYKNLLAEEIFILLMLPGIDMLRLFFIRIKNKQNPLNGDKRHLHHLLFYKLDRSKTILLYFFLFITPILSFYFKILSPNKIILLFLITYILIIIKFKK